MGFRSSTFCMAVVSLTAHLGDKALLALSKLLPGLKQHITSNLIIPLLLLLLLNKDRMVLDSHEEKEIGLVIHVIPKLNIVLAFVFTQAETTS